MWLKNFQLVVENMLLSVFVWVDASHIINSSSSLASGYMQNDWILIVTSLKSMAGAARLKSE